MKCPECRFDNREGVKFCEKCGAKMKLVCPNCEAKIPFDRQFCGECGHTLSKLKEAPPIDYAAPQSYTPKHLTEKILKARSSLEGERKHVTVLFADVANYTGLSEQLDPEEVHQIMEGCFRILTAEIHTREGTINQFTGDGGDGPLWRPRGSRGPRAKSLPCGVVDSESHGRVRRKGRERLRGGVQDADRVELPHTLPQDFTLLILMQEKDTQIWRKKLDWIVQCGGMALIITHPDYMKFDGEKPAINEYPASYYRDFLIYIKENYKEQYWNVLPRQMARFWAKNYVTKDEKIIVSQHRIEREKELDRKGIRLAIDYTMKELKVIKYKLLRNLRNFGFWITFKQIMLYLTKPFYENVVLFLLSIDVENIPEDKLNRSALTFKLVNVEDTSLINSIEKMEEWLYGKVTEKLSNNSICMAILGDGELLGFYLASLGEANIPLLGLRIIFKPDEAWAEQISISKNYRRKGLATRLKSSIYVEFRKRGIKTVYAATRVYNKAYLEFVRNFGFQKAFIFRYIKVLNYRKLIYNKIDLESLRIHKNNFSTWFRMAETYQNKKTPTKIIKGHSLPQPNGERYYFTIKTSELLLCLILLFTE